MALGALEAEVMDVLWQSSDALKVRDVLDALNEDRSEELAYTTVMTVLNRLAAKGVVSRSRRGRGFAYTPLAEDEAGAAVQEVLNRYGDAAVAHFVNASAADPEARERLRRLLEDE